MSFRDPEWWIQSISTPWLNLTGIPGWCNEQGTSLYEERYIRPEFVVSVDTSNPNVIRKLQDGLDMDEEMLREKARSVALIDFKTEFFTIATHTIQSDFAISGENAGSFILVGFEFISGFSKLMLAEEKHRRL